jgi:hypothetical protein
MPLIEGKIDILIDDTNGDEPQVSVEPDVKPADNPTKRYYSFGEEAREFILCGCKEKDKVKIAIDLKDNATLHSRIVSCSRAERVPEERMK